ncbi:hypothetical protein IE81DRAFT_336552 [Ceraceosorus guamensis]|uniref:DASH complex subunit DAM1 n=1 Tax=Ceraceosorus guamensis TaxID=1522189 RepID=A0A316W457_9BASI|nr:hypothetical protein IE81DRAFT_336552 [Ceraceosorus guamensis]PWN44696.1 hypothetical protein IE81DRAFT_336552 [Ceraceosorus guamensis]
MAARPTTPLRRVSRGSISASASLRRSQGPGADDTPLAFLDSAMSDLADETAVLQSNLEAVSGIHEALRTFDENFAMFLYGLKMNAFCVEWPEAPAEENFERAGERGHRLQEQQLARAQISSGDYSSGDVRGRASGGGGASGFNAGDQTYMTTDENDSFGPPTPKAAPAAQRAATLKPALKKTVPANGAAAGKTGAKAKITPALRKKRESIAATIIETLPLEYRGADPKPRALAENVILALMAAGPKGARINEIATTDMPSARVNKTLIALIAAKHVVKSSNNGVVYHLDPARHPDLP